MGKMERNKGKRGERELAAILRKYGYDTRRGVQYQGSPGSPDVMGLPRIHIECKRVQRLNLKEGLAQAVRDAGEDKLPALFHRRNRDQWFVSMRLVDWMVLYKAYNANN